MPSGIVFNDGYRSSMHNAWPGLTLEAFARAQRDQRKHAEELSYKDGKDNQDKNGGDSKLLFFLILMVRIFLFMDFPPFQPI